MTNLNLDIDYGRRPEQVESSNNISLSVDYIEYAVSQKFPQLKGQKLRIFGRLQRKLDECTGSEIANVELEAAELDLIKEAFKDVSFNANLAKFAMRLIEIIEKLEDGDTSLPTQGLKASDEKDKA